MKLGDYLASIRIILGVIDMKCFYHNDKDAVGICKSCEKGLCIDCAIDLGKGLACKNHCEEDVNKIIDYSQENIKFASRTSKIIQSTKTGVYLISSFYIVLGIAFIIWDLLSTGLQFGSIIGGLFILYGIINLIRNQKLNKIPDKK